MRRRRTGVLCRLLVIGILFALLLTGCKRAQRLGEFPVGPGKVDNEWQEAHPFPITPQGDIVFTTATEDGEEIEVPANVTIEETTDGCEDGFKKVICHCVMDFSTHRGFLFWSGAFDRYTGTTFEEYDIYKLSFDKVNYYYAEEDERSADGIWKRDMILYCPADYDGAVFDLGYASLDTAYDMEDEYGYHFERYYTMDQLPNFLREEPCYYFTYSNQ